MKSIDILKEKSIPIKMHIFFPVFFILILNPINILYIIYTHCLDEKTNGFFRCDVRIFVAKNLRFFEI